MFATGFPKDSSEISALWFTGVLDLADGSTEKTKRMQLNSRRMERECIHFARIIRSSLARDAVERERGRERRIRDSSAEVTALRGRVILPISYQKFSLEHSPVNSRGNASSFSKERSCEITHSKVI